MTPMLSPTVPPVPAELIDNILKFAAARIYPYQFRLGEEYAFFAGYCLVSKAWYCVAVRLLYRTIVLSE